MEKEVIRHLAVFLIIIFLIGGVVFLRYGDLTGFAVFNQENQNDFNQGIYQNTEYNGSSVILSSGTQGNYTSKIFDAGDTATWNFRRKHECGRCQFSS